MILLLKCQCGTKKLLILLLMVQDVYYAASATLYNSYNYNFDDYSLPENPIPMVYGSETVNSIKELQSMIIPELKENGEENLRFLFESIKEIKDIVLSDELKKFFGMLSNKLSFVCNDLDAFFTHFPANITGLGIEDKRIQNYKDIVKVLAESDDNKPSSGYGSYMTIVSEEVNVNPKLTTFICETVKKWLQIIKTEKFKAFVQDLYNFMELGCDIQEWKQSIQNTKNINNEGRNKSFKCNGNISVSIPKIIVAISSIIAINFYK